MSHPFTGQSSLTGFAFLLSDLLWLNEVSRRDPYHLYAPPSANSGHSFGAVQWDVPNHAPLQGARGADVILRDILLNAQDSNGALFFSQTTVDSIVNTTTKTGFAYVKGGTAALSVYLPLINAALDSAYGRATIDADHVSTINAYITSINSTVASVTDSADHAFLANSNLAKLFIGDVRNQFSGTTNALLQGYLQGQVAFGVTKQGVLGVDDLLNFYFRTPYAQALPHDPIRRFANVVAEAGGFTPTDVDEAKGVLQAYTFFVFPQKTQITSANADALTEFMTRVINPAKEPVIATFAEGRTIDGEVLVGKNDVFLGDTLDGTASGDLLFGEKGNDVLRGAAGTDVLYGGEGIDTLSGGADADLLRGGAGNDSLQGGAGDDLLEGGAGFDTYYFNSLTDGNDTIEDSDATGVIKVDGHVLTGGIKKAGDSTWKSPDGQFEYRLEGGHLKLTLNGNTLTINENFESGQFGIHLIDAKDLSAGLPTSGRIFEGDHEPVHPFQYDEFDNPIWVDPTRIPKIDYLQGSGGNDTIDAGELEDWLRGNGGDDVLLGGGGADRMQGGDGNDYLFSDQLVNLAQLASLNAFTGVGTGLEYLNSGAGDDVLVGGAVADELFGAAGTDLLLGGGGSDFLGGDDNWRLPYPMYPTFFYYDEQGTLIFANLVNDSTKQEIEEFGQADEMYGGDGADIIWGGGGNDLLYGDLGDDWMTGDSGEDSIFGGDGNDQIQGENSELTIGSTDDYLDGGNGDDYVLGAQGDDVVIGGVGSDHLYGEATNLLGVIGHDILDGGDGNDFLYGQGGDDTLVGGVGDDELIGDFTNDTAPGNDLLFGDAGIDLLQGEAGDDMLDGGDDDDQLLGGSGNDALFGGAGYDLLFGEATSFQGQAGDDTLDGGEGIDQLQGGGGVDTLFGGTGNDTLFGDDPLDVNIAGNDLLDGEQGDDELQGGLGSDTLFGGDGNDALRGDRMALAPNPANGGNDILDGEAGNDEIDGDSGNDVLTGGTGQDILSGGSGQDTYVLALGDGADTIEDATAVSQGDRLLFDAGITAADLTYTQTATTLTIAYSATDTVQLAGFNQNTVLGSLVVSTLQFADGSAVNLADLYPTFTNHAPTVANPIAEQTVPEDAPLSLVVPANTFADEDAGDTLIYSASQADGSALPAWLAFDAATRTFSGTPDQAQVGALNLKVTAADGRLESVSDTFTLTVTNSNDAPTVAAPLADQNAMKDEPFNFVVPAGSFADVDPGDTLVYGATLADGSPLPTWLTFNPSTRTFSGTPQLTDVGMLNVRVTATDTSNLSASDVFALTVAHGLNEITGTSANDNLTGTTGNDLIRGLAGNDTLLGQDGNDTLEGGDGNDQLSGGAGNDSLNGGNGADQLHAGPAGETGNNVLIGGAGADRLEGATGNDTFQGGPGSDTFYDAYGGQNVYLFGRGDGQDTIYSNYGTVRFAADVVSADVTVRGIPDGSLTLRIADTTDQISLFGWMNPSSTIRVDRVEFSDNTVWDVATLRTMANAGTASDDYLGGTNGNDVLVGLGGNDLIQAYEGDDVLDGGPGNDTLQGNLGGNDTYVFGRGYGVDLIQDEGGTADRIQLNAGVLVPDVTLLQNGSNVLLSIDQSPTQMTFTGIEQIVFNDGTTWDAAAMASHTIVGTVNSMAGTAGNDTFIVDNVQDIVTEAANAGTDSIQSLVSYTLPANVENLTLTSYFNVDGVGNSQENVLIGNSGNNKLFGGGDYWGADTDTLQGGLGDDYYTVIGNNDVVSEATNEGIDTIQLIGDANRGWSYALPQNVENLIVGSAGQLLPSARQFTGNALDNVIQGDLDWNNSIDGGLGADTMIGGRGADTYVVDHSGDVIKDTGNIDTVLSSISYALGADLENLTLTGTAAINGTGNELNNVLTGNSAANVLTGGAGDDTYVIGTGDTIVELSGEGIDTVSTDQSYTLGADLENVTLTGAAAINVTGNAVDNVLTGNSAANVLDGGAGADQLIGKDGDDTYLVGAGDTVVEQPFNGIDTVITDQTFTLSSDLENLTLTGTAAINGTGNVGNNILTGNSAANVLAGGAGDDTYVVNGADAIIENAGEGIDTVQTSASWVLTGDLENLTLTGVAAINGTGNDLNNILTGNSGTNVLTGGAGDDTYIVDGTDTILELANEGTDTVQSSASFTLTTNLEHLTLTDAAAVNGTGNALNNILNGNSGANVLDGGAGADTIFGDAGDDTYVVDNAGDTVTENASADTDTVQSSITYTLGANVENLTLTGTATINGTGNSLANLMIGNNAANTLAGGVSNDTYIVGAGDTVTEAASAGIDMVQSSVTFTLGSNIENLTLTGTAAINATGNTLNNQLVGNSAANVLSGGTGNDTMTGSAGDDTYVVNVAGDVVTELANEGVDTVQSVVTWTLGANVENLTLTGTTAINGTGNTLDNILTGNSAANTLTGGAGNDTLDGGAGNDTMVGGIGNDIYVVNATGDVVTEQANEGIDTMLSAVTRTLGSNFENLTLTGTGAINGTGNTLDNILTGNSGANVLTGGTGNDTYVVGTGDSIVENAGAGMDMVQSAITYTLGANIENLTLTGTTAINGTGNTANNTLTGNSANNVLTGLGGNDTYLYNRGGGQDRVVDNAGTSDTMLFGATINPLDLVISRQANDLRLAIHGSADLITIQNWYSGTTNQAETIQAGNGQNLLSAQVDQLIQAMAQFSQQTGLTWDQAIDQQPQDVQAVLAASWQ